MDVKRDKKNWVTARDDRVVCCECSCDQEELPMVLLDPATSTNCYANIRPFSSNASSAKNYNIITAMALLRRLTYKNIIAINVFLKIRIQ